MRAFLSDESPGWRVDLVRYTHSGGDGDGGSGGDSYTMRGTYELVGAHVAAVSCQRSREQLQFSDRAEMSSDGGGFVALASG